MVEIVLKIGRGSEFLSHDPQRQTLCCLSARKCWRRGSEGGGGLGGVCVRTNLIGLKVLLFKPWSRDAYILLSDKYYLYEISLRSLLIACGAKSSLGTFKTEFIVSKSHNNQTKPIRRRTLRSLQLINKKIPFFL